MRRYVVRRVAAALAVAAVFAALAWLSDAGASERLVLAPGLDAATVLVLGHCDPGYEHDDQAADPETDPCIESDPEPDPTPDPEPSCDPWLGLTERPDDDGCDVTVRPADDVYRVGLYAAALVVMPLAAMLLSTRQRGD